MADASSRGAGGALLDRLKLDEKRVEAMAQRARGHCRTPRSDRHRARRVDPAQRAAHPAAPGAARRDRHHLREQAERYRRCGSAMPEVRQCGDFARRLGECAVERRHPRVSDRGIERRGSAKHGHPAGADHGPRRRRLHAGRDGGVHRRDRAAGRQESHRTGSERGSRSGHRASRGRLPRIRRARGESRDGARHRAERQDAPHRRLRCGGDAAGRPRLRGHPPRAADRDTARGGVRGARR